MASLEIRERWVAFHPFHDQKKSQWHRTSERYAVGLDPYDSDYQNWPIQSLLRFLANSSPSKDADTAYRAVLFQLKSLGINLDALDEDYYFDHLNAQRICH
jgi:hypothetical protein